MTRKHNIVIVGAGLFGSVAAALARAAGHSVTVVNQKRPYSASAASGCVLAPSWLSSLDKADVANSMSVLGDLYKLHPLEFKTNLLKTFKAQRVHTADVLKAPDVVGLVTQVTDGAVTVKQLDGTQVKLRGTVLLCTGIWGQELTPFMPIVRGLYGASLRSPGQLLHPAINVYAPYRQAVGFNMDGKSIWFGDGTALVAGTWMKEEKERVSKTASRAAAMGVASGKCIIGARPYVEGRKSGYFEQISPKVFVSNGGSKNGTILAALQAYKFLKAI